MGSWDAFHLRISLGRHVKLIFFLSFVFVLDAVSQQYRTIIGKM